MPVQVTSIEGAAVKFRASSAKQFTEYQGLLWRVLGTLAQSGFVVRPGEGRDLIHDFYAYAWSGLMERFDQREGEFVPYVSTSFYRFARRRIIKEEMFHRRLVDLDVLEQMPELQANTSDIAERRHGVTVLRQLLFELPECERAVLTEFLREPQVGERERAARHAMTRYELRELLANAVGRLAVGLAGSGSNEDRDLKIATLIWKEGYATRAVANKLGISSAEVRSARERIVGDLLASVRDVGAGREDRREAMSDQEYLALLKRALISAEDRKILAQVSSHSREIHEALDRSDVELSEAEWARVRDNREWTARVYSALGAPTDEEETWSISRQVANDVRGKEEEEIGEAFARLMEDLPNELRDWEEWFTSVPAVSRPRREFLEKTISVASAGDAALGILQYGIAPVMVFGATRGLQLQFDSIARRRRNEASSDAHIVATLEFPSNPELGRIPVSQEQAVAAVAGTPELPEGTELPLAQWLLDVVTVRPWVIGGYRAQRTDFAPGLSFAPDKSWTVSKTGERLDLVRRWSLSDYNYNGNSWQASLR